RISEAEAIYGRATSEIEISPEGGQANMDEINKQASETAAPNQSSACDLRVVFDFIVIFSF
ncbi:MAG: hypothetical protein IJP33_01325, partial [Firmicutes bacterium]|nr:hypothetical protein [Bacillota bacterium]